MGECWPLQEGTGMRHSKHSGRKEDSCRVWDKVDHKGGAEETF